MLDANLLCGPDALVRTGGGHPDIGDHNVRLLRLHRRHQAVEVGGDGGELKPDLVLMDVNLPGINGLDATRRILKDSNGVVVVLLLSTYEEEEYASKAAECGARAYIAKSRFDPDRLAQAWASAG